MKTAPDTATTIADLDPLQKEKAEREADSIEARWKFGHILLRKRVGKQLPNGMRQEIAEHFGLEASEITRRMQLANKFDSRDELMAACTKHGGSWRQIIANELITSRRSRDIAWSNRVGRVEKGLDALMQEANGSDDRLEAVKRMICEKARALGLIVTDAQDEPVSA